MGQKDTCLSSTTVNEHAAGPTSSATGSNTTICTLLMQTIRSLLGVPLGQDEVPHTRCHWQRVWTQRGDCYVVPQARSEEYASTPLSGGPHGVDHAQAMPQMLHMVINGQDRNELDIAFQHSGSACKPLLSATGSNWTQRYWHPPCTSSSNCGSCLFSSQSTIASLYTNGLPPTSKRSRGRGWHASGHSVAVSRHR